MASAYLCAETRPRSSFTAAAMSTCPGIAAMLAGLRTALPADVWLVRVGVEAAGHYQPMIGPWGLAAGLAGARAHPAQVTAQRRVNGSRG